VYSIAEQIAGPLVQRVNRQVFVVKCDTEPRHPLGYLHIAFIEQKLRDRPGLERRFFCSCDTFRGLDRSVCGSVWDSDPQLSLLLFGSGSRSEMVK
jgi:hypothetical protein